MNKYEIHIGEIFDLTTNSKKPKQTLIITQDQLELIEQFADQRKDSELNTIYKLNECEFRILPHFDFGASAETVSSLVFKTKERENGTNKIKKTT